MHHHGDPADPAAPALEPPSQGAPPAGSSRDEFHKPHPNVRTIWMMGGLIFAALAGTIALVVELSTGGFRGIPLPGLIAAGIFILLVLRAVIVPGLRYAAWSYAVRPRDVVASFGVLWRKRVCIPRSRLQHVDVESGPLERKFGLCHMELYTAGSPVPAVTLVGLTPDRAEELRIELIGPPRSLSPEQGQGEGLG